MMIASLPTGTRTAGSVLRDDRRGELDVGYASGWRCPLGRGDDLCESSSSSTRRRLGNPGFRIASLIRRTYGYAAGQTGEATIEVTKKTAPMTPNAAPNI